VGYQRGSASTYVDSKTGRIGVEFSLTLGVHAKQVFASFVNMFDDRITVATARQSMILLFFVLFELLQWARLMLRIQFSLLEYLLYRID